MTKKGSNKLIYILSGVALVLLLIVIIGKKKGFIGGEKGTEVEVAEVITSKITEKVSATGKIHPVREIKISPDVSGEIIELFITEGDSVTEGQLLLKIKPDNYKSMLDQAIAGLNSAKANQAQSESRLAQTKANNIQTEQNYLRNKKLHEQKVISDAEFESINAAYKVSLEELEAAKQTMMAAAYNVQSAAARVTDARENLNKTSIYAPANGTISKLAVEQGERVVGTSQMAGTELLRIANLSMMEVRVNVNENDIVRVSEGDKVQVEVDSYSREEELFEGLVASIAHTANDVLSLDAVTEFEVKIKLLNSSYSHLVTKEKPFPFRPGMTATVDIITDEKEDIVVVPISSVTTREKAGADDEEKKEEEEEVNEEDIEEVVFVVNEENIVNKTIVKTGISDFDNIEIVSGVKSGDKIVKGPYKAVSKELKDGDKVTIKSKEEGDSKGSGFNFSVEVK